MPPSRRSRQPPLPSGTTPRERGYHAFQAGRLDEAIAAWQRADADPAVARALAEAHFRRALSARAADPLADLRRAAELSPADSRFPFHLGRLLHRAGEREAAAEHYRAVLAREPGHSAAARLLALLTLEQYAYAELADLPGMTPAVVAWAAPAVAVLRRKPPPDDGSALGTFWRGLGQLAAKDPGALASLSDERPLPASALAALRRYYRGVAAALAGDHGAALAQWQQLYAAGERALRLEANLAALLHERLAALVDAGEATAAGKLALEWADLAGDRAFDELRLRALDAAARASATAGAWAQAALQWEAARAILGRAQGLGSPRPILHNLALAYERLENWEEAAGAWRALLRTRPRKAAGVAADPQEEQRWAWVRERIIACYKDAGRPDEAVTVFRQALKLDPNDLDLRMQLADALLANDQERAAANELKRILAIDPHHPEAGLRYAEQLSERWQFSEAEQLVRELAERHPQRADLRQRVGQVFLQHGREHSSYGHYEAAYEAFVEGERYHPENPRFPLNQARMLAALGRPVDTAALVERALAVGGQTNETWVLAIETWVMANDVDQARALIARFERERVPDADDFVMLGLQLMATALPPPPPAFFARLAPPPPPVNTPATALALELLERAVTLRPDDQRISLGIASFLMLPRPDLALPFAERAAQLDPDSPEAQILLGVVLGLGNQTSKAKTTLQRAAKLALRLGRPELRREAEELRKVVGTPMLRIMLSAGMEDEMLDELDDFFG